MYSGDPKNALSRGFVFSVNHLLGRRVGLGCIYFFWRQNEQIC